MIALDQISIHAGAFTLRQISFAIPAGAYGVLMGPTGCGKTTLIEIICGLRRPSSGRVIIGGIDVTRQAPGNRGIGYVPQDGALFPSLTVARQLGFALRLRRWPAARIASEVAELANRLRLSHLLTRKPPGLSGGERQRVALGRALAARPSVLLLDEPLSALDEETRNDLRDLLKSIQRDFRTTVLHVTHDRSEASELADVLLTMQGNGVNQTELAKR